MRPPGPAQAALPARAARPAHQAARRLRRLTTATTLAGLVLAAAPGLAGVSGPPSASPDRPGEARAGLPVEPDAGAGAVLDATSELTPVAKKGKPRRIIKRYRVRPGDTPSGLAVRFRAWTDEVVAMNGPVLYVGDVIRIPVVPRAQRSRSAARGDERREASKQKADRSSKKAKKAAAKPKKKKAVSAKPKKKKAGKAAGKKKPGQKGTKATKKSGPKKPKADRPRSKKPDRPRHRRPHRVRHRHGWHHEHASRARVRKVITRKARRHGVDPHLALAIAWQESGWQQYRVSSAGALGAMQIMPGTGRWISSLVGYRLNPRDLYDNATTGVRLIRILKAEARPRIAVAGYYQGLAGVRRHGMYDDTKRYVANVIALRKRLEAGWHPE